MNLCAKGALPCLATRFHDALTITYGSYLQQLCPIIDLHEFLLPAAYADGASVRANFLVFQVVMLAEVAFVPLSTPQTPAMRRRIMLVLMLSRESRSVCCHNEFICSNELD
jgi:hypothetical protein